MKRLSSEAYASTTYVQISISKNSSLAEFEHIYKWLDEVRYIRMFSKLLGRMYVWAGQFWWAHFWTMDGPEALSDEIV